MSASSSTATEHFKDCKAWVDKTGATRVKAWDWRETGTRHRPGVQRADVQEIIDAGVDAVVVTQGVNGVLECQSETMEHLKSCEVEVWHLLTPLAVLKFNSLVAEGRAVGGVFHSTC